MARAHAGRRCPEHGLLNSASPPHDKANICAVWDALCLGLPPPLALTSPGNSPCVQGESLLELPIWGLCILQLHTRPSSQSLAGCPALSTLDEPAPNGKGCTPLERCHCCMPADGSVAENGVHGSHGQSVATVALLEKHAKTRLAVAADHFNRDYKKGFQFLQVWQGCCTPVLPPCIPHLKARAPLACPCKDACWQGRVPHLYAGILPLGPRRMPVTCDRHLFSAEPGAARRCSGACTCSQVSETLSRPVKADDWGPPRGE